MKNELMNQLHPAADGEFDLGELLKHPFAAKWTPREVGETISGVVDYHRNEKWYGNDVPVLYITTPGGNHHKIVASGIVLRNQVAEQEVVVGDVIRIRYDGEAEAASGRTYKKYLLAKGAEL